jgi:sugar-specific transcriptional regulator TrmB
MVGTKMERAIVEVLNKIGLTNSEAKVYLALLKLKKPSSKTSIIYESKISSSKVYEILNKLKDKGLVSTITNEGISNFIAASPSKLKDYLEKKKELISLEEKEVSNILPNLEEMYKSLKENTTAEIFIGWKGMETAYSTILNSMTKGQKAYILGASEGEDKEKTKEFFLKYASLSKLKGIKVKILFNENAKGYVSKTEKELRIKFNKRFISKSTPVEIAFSENITALIILKAEPIILLIKDKDTAEGFKFYFEELWKTEKI